MGNILADNAISTQESDLRAAGDCLARKTARWTLKVSGTLGLGLVRRDFAGAMGRICCGD